MIGCLLILSRTAMEMRGSCPKTDRINRVGCQLQFLGMGNYRRSLWLESSSFRPLLSLLKHQKRIHTERSTRSSTSKKQAGQAAKFTWLGCWACRLQVRKPSTSAPCRKRGMCEHDFLGWSSLWTLGLFEGWSEGWKLVLARSGGCS